MNVIKYLSNLAIPFTILIILVLGLTEKVKVFDTFLDGAKEGIETVTKIFPTLIGLFLAIGLLRDSGILEFVINLMLPITNFLHIPKEIMPLAMLRPISRKWGDGNRNRHNANLWSRQQNWANCCDANGIDRDDILYHCSIHKCSRNQKNPICFNCCFNWGFGGCASFCNYLAFFVVICENFVGIRKRFVGICRKVFIDTYGNIWYYKVTF